ncbi:uncharacterized protein HaLaN_14509, partial [Haematococcus lacustris]
MTVLCDVHGQSAPSESSAAATVASPGGAPDNRLVGTWIKDPKASDSMGPACDVMALNGVVRMAVSLVARPGRDVLHLVTVVATAAHVEEGEALLQHYYLAALKSLVSCKLEVLVRQPWSFLDVLEWGHNLPRA